MQLPSTMPCEAPLALENNVSVAASFFHSDVAIDSNDTWLTP